MSAYYNEHDPFAAAWLRELVTDGLIADGEVDERDIQTIDPADLRGFTQCHFFAGIGGWSLALRLAGWPDDRPVWTGSCQKQLGRRHDPLVLVACGAPSGEWAEQGSQEGESMAEMTVAEAMRAHHEAIRLVAHGFDTPMSERAQRVVDTESALIAAVRAEQRQTVAALKRALEIAGEVIHSEYCGVRHHEECKRVEAALALVKEGK